MSKFKDIDAAQRCMWFSITYTKQKYKGVNLVVVEGEGDRPQTYSEEQLKAMLRVAQEEVGYKEVVENDDPDD